MENNNEGFNSSLSESEVENTSGATRKDMRNSSKRFNRRSLLSGGIGLVSLVAGGVLISNGMQAKPTDVPPDISAPVIAPKNQVKVGPERVKHENKVITLNNMDKSKLLIPSINVYASIDNSGDKGKVNREGLILSEASKVTRWVKGSNVESNKGNILLAGHVSFDGTPGALFNLAKVKPGSVAMVSNSSGKKQEFQLESMVSYKKESLPENVWSPRGDKKLIVVTCGGKLHKLSNGTWHFDSNIVSVWKPVSKVI